MDAVAGGDEAQIEAAFVRFSAAYNAFAEGVLTMPSYEIVIDTTLMWDAFPALREGFRRILADEGRHITFGSAACRILIEKTPAHEALVHEVFDEYRGNLVGLVEYQKAVPGPRPAEVPDDEGAPLPQPLPRDAHHPRRDADRADPRPRDRLRRRRGGGLVVARAWRCLEAGCDEVVVAADDAQLVAAVNRHVGEAHGSFELEDVILDAAEDAASR